MNPRTRKTDGDEAASHITPPVNICETRDAIIVEAEMPGVDTKRLEVSVDGDELVITGRRAKYADSGEAILQEIDRADFRRAFTLGDQINRSEINASFEAGILKLKLGKAEDVKRRKIEVEFN